MPVQAWIEPNPAYKPSTAEEKAAFEAVKARGAFACSAPTALENVRSSKGMYRHRPDTPQAPTPPPVRNLADMSIEELKLMSLSFGIKIEKQMKKADLVAFLQSKVDAMPIIDDE